MLPIGIANFYLIVFPLVCKVVQHGDLLFSMLHNITRESVAIRYLKALPYPRLQSAARRLPLALNCFGFKLSIRRQLQHYNGIPRPSRTLCDPGTTRDQTIVLVQPLHKVSDATDIGMRFYFLPVVRY